MCRGLNRDLRTRYQRVQAFSFLGVLVPINPQTIFHPVSKFLLFALIPPSLRQLENNSQEENWWECQSIHMFPICQGPGSWIFHFSKLDVVFFITLVRFISVYHGNEIWCYLHHHDRTQMSVPKENSTSSRCSRLLIREDYCILAEQRGAGWLS